MALAMSPDSRLLTTTSDKAATLWDLATGKRSNHFLLPGQNARLVAFTPNGRFIAVTSWRDDATIRLVEMASGREVLKIAGYRGWVRSLAFLRDGPRLVAGMQDGSAFIWDVTH